MFMVTAVLPRATCGVPEKGIYSIATGNVWRHTISDTEGMALLQTFQEQADGQQITKKIGATGLARTPSLQCGSSGHLGRHEDLRDDSAFGSRICIAISNDVRASKNDRIESDRWENL
jgi:hypothetical protein